MEQEKKDKGFVIKDRRLFDESGSARTEAETRTAETKAETKSDEPKPLETTEAPESEEGPLPEINFASFIFSLSTTAMYHFGDFPDPVTQKGQRNLPAAKQTIDILTILKTKTEGNLEADERQLLDKMLYELRMRYVKEMTPK
jgi:hypothetical protein